MTDADEPPRDRVTERFARRLFRRVCAGEPLRRIAIALRVRDFRFGEHLASESFELEVIEFVAMHFRDVDADPDDHTLMLPDARARRYRRTGAERVENRNLTVEKISLVPMNGVGTDFCERLAPCLEERFFHKFAVEKPLTLSLTQANATRPDERSDARALRIWLSLVAALVFLMVIVGGAVRLTESGLSITEWKPVTGIVPPLSHGAWLAEFEKYKQIPQYRELFPEMDL